MDEIQKFSFAKLLRLPAIYFKAFWAMLTNRYDGCYIASACFGKPFLKDAPLILLSKLLCKRTIIHQHNKGAAEYSNRRGYKWLYRKAYRGSSVILLSELLYPDIAAFTSKSQIQICHNGIGEARTSAIPQGKKDNNKKVKLLYLSNLIPSKGCNVFLDAVEILSKRNLGREFEAIFIGGESPELSAENFNKQITERGLTHFARYLGKKYGGEKEAIFKEADIFVFPTFYSQECFPMVLLEAMQQGLPCVTTDEGGIPDIIEHNVNGLICNKNDAADLADKLERLITDDDFRKSLGKKALEKYNRNFTSEIFEKRILSILQQTVSQ